MKFTSIAILVLLALTSLSCREKKQEEARQQNVHARQGGADDLHTAVVQEVIQATSYTYLNVKEADSDYWIAVTKRQIEPGVTISFAEGLEMNNFESKDLKRTFEKIYFVNRIIGGESSTTQRNMSMPGRTRPEPEKKDISVEPAEGGVTISELFASRDSYAGKSVLVRGQVTKVNRAIMDKNWVHLQDGTGYSGNFDLTVTTTDDVEVGDVVMFEGKIALNKDFGAGYYYELIMEEAKLQAQ